MADSTALQNAPHSKVQTMSVAPFVVTVGGGIGGVALAKALIRQGIRVRIFEQASAFEEVGAGVQVTPNAVRVIEQLGLGGALPAVVFRPNAIVGRHWKSGKTLFRTDLGAEFVKRYGAPYYQMHRADLLDIFVRGLPAEVTTFSARVVDIRSSGNRATVVLHDGTSVEADLVVGADGVRSVVQRSIFGETPPRFTGNMCFRTMIPVDSAAGLVTPDNNMWLGPKGHVVCYYVKAGRMVNVVAITETPTWKEEGWNAKSDRDELLSHFEGWHPGLVGLLSRADTVFRWGLFDRDPLPRWSKGCVTLLGDAAHPMLPFLSQGAAMAIEDAYELAGTLSETGFDVPRSLEHYEGRRRSRTARIQLESRKRAETYHLPSPFAQFRRDVEYRLRAVFAPKSSGLNTDWIYKYDATRPEMQV